MSTTYIVDGMPATKIQGETSSALSYIIHKQETTVIKGKMKGAIDYANESFPEAMKHIAFEFEENGVRLTPLAEKPDFIRHLFEKQKRFFSFTNLESARLAFVIGQICAPYASARSIKG